MLGSFERIYMPDYDALMAYEGEQQRVVETIMDALGDRTHGDSTYAEKYRQLCRDILLYLPAGKPIPMATESRQLLEEVVFPPLAAFLKNKQNVGEWNLLLMQVFDKLIVSVRIKANRPYEFRALVADQM
jgi:hypothetical protein